MCRDPDFWKGEYPIAYHPGDITDLNIVSQTLVQSEIIGRSCSLFIFAEAHPCNMKDFKLYVGETEESMNKVLHGNLRNDHTAETFSIPHVNSAGVPFATRYVKIVPLS